MIGEKPPTDALHSAELDELKSLREENAHLKVLLTTHGIAWEIKSESVRQPPASESGSAGTEFSTTEKLVLFRRLFRGRSDVYPARWESAKGSSGYSPACGNEWKPGICQKPKIKCGDCAQRLLLPVTDQVIYDHLAGKLTIGVYPLMIDDTCFFLAVDFDEGDWREDARAIMETCRQLDIPAALEISRSGKGGHVWFFFAEPVRASEARQLGAALISHTCDRTRQLSLSSYDRLFPNQDTMPKGGFGNLIALPLQKQPRQRGGSVFVDENFMPYPDQWQFLVSIKAIAKTELEDAILRASGGRNPLDVAFAIEKEDSKPWQRPPSISNRLSGPLPETLNLVLANQIFITKTISPNNWPIA